MVNNTKLEYIFALSLYPKSKLGFTCNLVALAIRTPFDSTPPELANMHDLAGLQW